MAAGIRPAGNLEENHALFARQRAASRWRIGNLLRFAPIALEIGEKISDAKEIDESAGS
jgi:hypothetical protein